MDKEEIGLFIKKLREEKKMTQQELADAIYCSRSNLAHIESGRVFPSHDKVELLAKILNITETEIYSGKRLKTKEEINIAYYNIWRYFNTKYKRIIILSVIITIICLLFLFAFYFFSSYKTIKLYNISGESANYKVDSGLLLLSKEKIILDLKVENKNDLQLRKITLKYKTDNSDSLVLSTDDNNIYIIDFYKYNAYLDYTSISKCKGIFYIEIESSDNSIEVLNLKTKKEFINDFFSPKPNTPIISHQETGENDNSIPQKIKEQFNLKEDNIYYYNYEKNDVEYSLSYDFQNNIFTVIEGNKNYNKCWIYYLDIKNILYSYSKDSNLKKELDFNIDSMNEEEAKVYNEFENNYINKYFK